MKMEGPKPNVDYGRIAASLPKINAQIEFIDKGIFQAAQAETRGNRSNCSD
jgi:hypothetical protein